MKNSMIGLLLVLGLGMSTGVQACPAHTAAKHTHADASKQVAPSQANQKVVGKDGGNADDPDTASILPPNQDDAANTTT